ncbi:hypothetical protein LBHB_05535 [Leptospira borgpetersenii serovar Hardjo]|nr:hypothetical protein LBHB_05535 [Leptospira borgpetersenii serovar Hardjo]
MGQVLNKLWESKPSKWSFFVKPNKHPWELFEKYLLKRKRTGIKRIPPNRKNDNLLGYVPHFWNRSVKFRSNFFRKMNLLTPNSRYLFSPG